MDISQLANPGVFAILVVRTQQGETILQPIGGDNEYNIKKVAQKMVEEYPECTMRLFEQEYDSYHRYFKSVIPIDRLLS